MSKYKIIFQNENPDWNEDDSQSEFNEAYIEWLESKLTKTQLALVELQDAMSGYEESPSYRDMSPTDYFIGVMKQAKEALL